MSFTAGRQKPPRSAINRNPPKPCTPPAPWNGKLSRRNRAEPLPLPRRQRAGGAPTELTVTGGPRVRIHLPPAVSLQTFGPAPKQRLQEAADWSRRPLLGPAQPHSRRLASAAPAASASSFAHAICGCTRPPRPQSVEAMTRSRPTRSAKRRIRSATSSGCSTTFVA